MKSYLSFWGFQSLAGLFVAFVLSLSIASADTFFVATNSASDGPGTAWTNAFHSIQGAVDAASDNDTVLVTNGTYVLTSEIKVTQAISVCSVNGQEVTIVDGQNTCRGFCLSNNICSVSGFTITNGMTYTYGGGICCRYPYTYTSVSNCLITGCQAAQGGGIYGGTMRQSVLRGNTATNHGGGAYITALDNCLVIGNVAGEHGGGSIDSYCINCTIFGNSAGIDGGGTQFGALWNSIIWSNDAPSYKDIGSGVGTRKNICSSDISYCDDSISNYPRFKGPDDFRLADDSPCINAGDNDSAPEGGDLAGNPRISSRKVDIGAYECQYVHVYVDDSRPDDSGCGLTWGTAKKTIPAAIELTTPEVSVLITDGVYQLSSEITVDCTCTVESVNGPEVTIVDGQDTCRCFVLSNNVCTLSGLTITNGNASSAPGGGVYCNGTVPIITNCIISGNHADMDGGGINRGTVIDCTLSGNTSGDEGGATSYSDVFDSTLSGNAATNNGGGAYYGTVVNCVLSNNTADSEGGGAYEADLLGCTVVGNTASGNAGGGLRYGSASNCTIIGNIAANYGGGSALSTLIDCELRDNHSDLHGGGASGGVLIRCVLENNTTVEKGGGLYTGGSMSCLFLGNEAGTYGGGACDAAVTNGTLIGNVCAYSGGGISGGTNINCIAWSNTASGMGNDIYAAVVGNSCASDGLTNGVDGCTTNNPLFTDFSGSNYILQAVSPCVNGGNGKLAGSDLAGNPRTVGSSVDVGAYEFQYYFAYVDATQPDDSGNGFSWDTAKKTIQAGVDLQAETLWVSNGVYTLASQIDVQSVMTIRSVNGPEVTVVDGQGTCRVFDLNTHAGCLDGFTITNGFDSGSGGGLYSFPTDPAIITNCIISGNESESQGGGAYGGIFYNCILSGNVSKFQGGGARYCTLYDCVIFDNWADLSGAGGVTYATLYNCSVYSNSGYVYGGGARESTLYHCTVFGNESRDTGYGGGLYDCDAYDCVVRDNRGGNAGGAYYGSLYNCTVVNNYATNSGGGGSDVDAYNCVFWGNTADVTGNDLTSVGAVQNSCASDGITHGVDGCITNDPLFVDAANSNYTLQAGSPCINTGSNDYVTATNDLAGNPRIINAIVDMGAYEYIYSVTDYDGDGMLNAWENRHGLDELDSADRLLNPDGDAYDNAEEYIADTDPQNSNSYFHVTGIDDSASCVVSFVCTNSRAYSLHTTTNLLDGAWVPVDGATNITGVYNSMSLTDTVDAVQRSYRVGVSLP